MPASVGIRVEVLRPPCPWQAVQFRAMKAPCSGLPAAISASVLLVQAIRVEVCNAGRDSALDPLSEVIPRPRQIAFQRFRSEPFRWYRSRTPKPSAIATTRMPAAMLQPIFGQGLSILKLP